MKKKTMAPGRQVKDPPSSPPPLPPLSSCCSFPYCSPLPIFPRTQHVVPAFIIIVIIISVDGPLMNRCEDSRAGRDSRGTAKKTEKEGASRGRKRERQRERQEADAKDGPCGEDKMVKKRKKKWLPSEGGTARKEEGFHRGFRGWPPGNL